MSPTISRIRPGGNQGVNKVPPSFKDWCNGNASGENNRFCGALWKHVNRPWLTMILGTGCVDSESLSANVGALVLWCKDHGGESRACLPSTVDGEPIGEFVARYAKDLAADRLQADPWCADGDGDISRVDACDRATLFDLLGVSALYTRLYYEIKAGTSDAPHRPNHEDEAVLRPSSFSWGVLDRRRVQQTLQSLRSLKTTKHYSGAGLTDVERDVISHVVDAILESTESEKQNVKIRFKDVAALAELAWFQMSKLAGSGYPGWGDLLSHLSNYDRNDEGMVGRPIFKDLTAPAQYIRTRFEELSQTSPALSAVHTTVAGLLVTQEKYRQEAEKRATMSHPPAVAAFVTSFDLELERALLAEGQAFTMAMPVHALTGDYAHTAWIACDVQPDNKIEGPATQLQTLTQPADGTWSVLDGRVGDRGPVIVRLAGCPMVSLDRALQDEAFKEEFLGHIKTNLREVARLKARRNGHYETKWIRETQSDLEDALTLEHAVILSEYDALWHSAIDLLSLTEGTPLHGLPRAIASDSLFPSKDPWTRFWVVLGVQIHDTACRHRVASLVSSVPLSAPGIPPPARHGIAVNSCSRPLERDLLLWNGLEIVADGVDKVAESGLEHYRQHLAEALEQGNEGLVEKGAGNCVLA